MPTPDLRRNPHRLYRRMAFNAQTSPTCRVVLTSSTLPYPVTLFRAKVDKLASLDVYQKLHEADGVAFDMLTFLSSRPLFMANFGESAFLDMHQKLYVFASSTGANGFTL